MANLIVSLSMHDATVTLDIPKTLIKKLELLNLPLSSDRYNSPIVHIYPLDDRNTHFWTEDKNKIIEDIIIQTDHVIFRLFVELEDLLMRQILSKNSSGFALHGGGVVVNGQAILVLQEKGGGKSTLIAKLAQNKKHRFLSDDLLIIIEKNVLGIPFPIRLRQLRVDGLDLSKDRIEYGIDIDSKIRYFYTPTIDAETHRIPVSTILIPHYDPNCTNTIIQAQGYEKVHTIIGQIKKYTNMEQIYSNILLLAKSVNIYHLYYKDFSFLDSEFIWD